MLRNYFKTAWRNILKNKFYATINIIGLTIGLTVGLLILLWVNDELSFDAFHANSSQIYHVNAQIGSGATRQVWDGVQAPVATFGLREVPGIKQAVRFVPMWDYSVYRYKDKQLKPGENGAAYVDNSMFSMFDFKLLKGDVNHPFPNIHSMIITQSTAKRFFGDEDPIGKILQADNKDNYTVAGLMPDFPQNSSIKYDILFPIAAQAAKYSGKDFWKSMDSDWGNYYSETFIQLQPGTSIKSVQDKLTAIHIKNQPGPQAANVSYLLQPLTKQHLYKPDGSEGGMETVRIFLIVAVLILLIACINYINLSTARAMLRSKEVSIRKIIGAERTQLFIQFVAETFIYFFIALALSFGLIKLLMPFYNNLSGKQMEFNLLDASVWRMIGITAIAVLAASSIYPALLLSSFKPINALRGKLSIGVGNASFRKGLVVCQFVFSIGLIIGTLIINKQLNYIRSKELGYDRSYVFAFNMRDMMKNYDAIRSTLLNQPGIKDVTSAGDDIISIGNTTSDTEWDGKSKNESFMIHPMSIDKDYTRFFKLKFVAGSGFQGLKIDTAHYILNETAVREAGIKDPIGKRFKLHDWNGIIIGVVKDFHFASLRQKIEPAVFYYRPANWRMFVRTTGADAPKAIASIQKQWAQYNPGFPLDYQFMDDKFDEMYRSDQRSGTLFTVFSLIAIVISCLGLFGLATYTAQVKIKEIGIRKVLGASVSNITAMLSRDFLALVVVAIVIATPIAWYAMNKWLEGFIYRTSINIWIFLMAGVAAVAIAFLTISFQAIRAALANPLKSLRSE